MIISFILGGLIKFLIMIGIFVFGIKLIFDIGKSSGVGCLLSFIFTLILILGSCAAR